MARSCLAVVVLVAFASLAGPKPPAEPPAFVKPPTQEQYVAIAQKAFDDAFTSKDDLKKATEAVASRPKTVKDILGRASMGAVEVAFGKPEGVANLALAAMDAPDNAIVATTFGVALAHAKKKDAALKVQLYANQLAPRTPQILTNLGSVYADLGENSLAKMRLLEATTFDRDHCPAWNALAIVYANEGDARRGVQAYLHALPCSTIKQRRGQLREESRKEPPKSTEAPSGTGADGAGAGGDQGGGGGKAGAELEIREFPNWSSVEVFMGAKDSFDRWKNELAALRDQATKDMNPQAPVAANQRRQRLQQEHPGAVVMNPNEEAGWGLDDLRYRYGKQLDELSKAHNKETSVIDQRLSDQLAQSTKSFEQIPLEGLQNLSAAPLEAARQRHNVHCRGAKQLVGTAFVQWRDSEKRYYDRVVELLREYWKLSGELLGLYNDDGERTFMQGSVELTIWGRLGTFPMTYPTRALMYRMHLVSPLGPCDKDVPPPQPPAAAKEARPPKMKPTCPVPKGVSVDAEVSSSVGCSVAIEGCESVGAECKAPVAGPFGVVGGASYSYENKELTLSGGSYVEFSPPQVGPASASVGFRSVIDITTRGGQVQRVSWTVGPTKSIGVSAGGVGASTNPPLKQFDDKSTSFTLYAVPQERPLAPGELRDFKLPTER
ncbi:MAG: hypothetical protein JNJ54_03470 [Myxococcaceae bacterium]|nr:hypothetical protein [Myxococcaceae bacterium]